MLHEEAELIIETVSDEMEMKIELFTIFDKFAKPGAIFASTTTSLRITDLAAVTFRPERCIGMRFFTDFAQHTGRLELVKGRETSRGNRRGLPRSWPPHGPEKFPWRAMNRF